jgi:hypothetical protein
LQATVQLVWLQIMLVGDLEIAAYCISHAAMLALLVARAWRLRPISPLRRHAIHAFVRLLHTVAIPLAAATSAMPQYHTVEMLLRVGRWRVFAGAGWTHALLLNVGWGQGGRWAGGPQWRVTAALGCTYCSNANPAMLHVLF